MLQTTFLITLHDSLNGVQARCPILYGVFSKIRGVLRSFVCLN